MSARRMPLEVAREIARQGELRLSSLLTMGIAADSRAMTLCALLGASCAAVLGGLIAYVSQEHTSQKVIAAAVAVATALFVSAGLAAFAGSPQAFFVAGGHPKKLRVWAWTGEEWRGELEMLDSTAMRYAVLIDRDRRALNLGGRRFMRAVYLALLSLPLGVLAYLVR